MKIITVQSVISRYSSKIHTRASTVFALMKQRIDLFSNVIFSTYISKCIYIYMSYEGGKRKRVKSHVKQVFIYDPANYACIVKNSFKSI